MLWCVCVVFGAPGKAQRIGRKFLTTLLSLLFIFASFCFLYWASYRRQVRSGRDPRYPPPHVLSSPAHSNVLG